MKTQGTVCLVEASGRGTSVVSVPSDLKRLRRRGKVDFRPISDVNQHTECLNRLESSNRAVMKASSPPFSCSAVAISQG